MLVTPEQLQNALLAIQPGDTKPIWPLEKFRAATERIEYLLPVLAILSVLELPKLQQPPKGRATAYITACVNAFAILVKPAAPHLAYESELHNTSSGNGISKSARILKLQQHIAVQVVSAWNLTAHMNLCSWHPALKHLFPFVSGPASTIKLPGRLAASESSC